jgi:hypothetical protein
MSAANGSGRNCADCGLPLSRYNPDDRCQSCLRTGMPPRRPEGRRRRVPDYLPAEILARPDFRDACARHDFGAMFLIMHEYRDQGWTFSHIGRRCEITNIRTYTKCGTQPESLYLIERVSDGLHIPADMLRIGRRAWESESVSAELFAEPQEIGSFDPGSYPSADIVAQVALPQTGLFRLVPFGNSALYDADAMAMQAFRTADLQVGGGHLYASVTRYLHSDVAPRLFGSDGESTDSRVIFTAAGALTEMAGWMAHDAGSDAIAKLHFERALALVEVGGDRQLSAHILGSMSHLASHLNQPDKAIERARQGQAVLNSGPPNPDLIARLLALEARGFAAKKSEGSTIICGQLLLRAEKALEIFPAEPISPWVSRFDEGSLASEAARCMRQLGDLTEERRQAERIIELRPGTRTRSRALGQLILATVLIRQGELDEACVVAQEVINSTQSLGSYLVIRQLIDLKPLLEPYRSTAVIADFLGFLDEALSQRQWLYQWLTRGVS